MTHDAGWGLGAGARPKTLGAAVAPVLVGTAAASLDGSIWWRARVAALVVALALQVGVNYANDYSDGVRGTDKDRRGPVRSLPRTRVAGCGRTPRPSPSDRRSRRAGALARRQPVAAARGRGGAGRRGTYTGGPKPYGYLGLGEVMVLVFFGFVATVGSAYVQDGKVPGAAWWARSWWDAGVRGPAREQRA